MRSSKSRSRSKPNRPRTLGNIINRVFDSSGPEGKVRGTPQQLIEKYQQLGRDAQLSNDRVAAENYMQHSEHYTRLLAEAMREMAAEQEARQSQQGQNGNSNQGGNQGGNPNGNGGGQYGQRGDRPDYRNDGNQQPRNDQPRFDQPRFDQPRGDQPRNDQPRSDNRQDNRPDNRGDQRFEQRNDRQNDRPDNRPDNRPDTRPDNRPENRPDNRAENRRDDRRDDRRATPVDVVTFAEVDDDTGLVETPEARRVLPVEAGAVVQPVSTEVAPAPPDEGAKRARAPRRPRAEPESAAPVVDGPDAAPEKPARSRGPAKPREAAE